MRERTAAVYKLVNVKTGNFYIGASQDLTARIRGHFSELERGVHSCRRMQAEYKKHGRRNFEVEILCMEKYTSQHCQMSLKFREREYKEQLKPTLNNDSDKCIELRTPIESKYEVGKKIPVLEILSQRTA